jgi:starvation-inducible outer membrane lipoprotein
MKTIVILAVSLALSGCVGGLSSLGGSGDNAQSTVETIKALSAHMGQCDRHYQGGIGLGASFTFNVDCKATAVPLSEFGKPLPPEPLT